MILHPKSPPRHRAARPGATPAMPPAPLPAWLRRAVAEPQSLASKDVEDVALIAGAAIGALDQVVRRQEKWAGAWRQRLALAAAAVITKQTGRLEDEAALRDAVLLTRPGDDAGPGGRMFLGWCRLAGTPAEKLLTEASIGAALHDLGLARNDEGASDLADELRQLAGSGLVGMLRGAFEAADRHRFGRGLGAWLADALLAQRLGWDQAVPLLGTEAALGRGLNRPRRVTVGVAASGLELESDQAKSLLAAQARAAVRAIDLSAELDRRADRLTAVTPKLRAKGADAIVERLLNEDALVASRGEQNNGMSDRGLRRLFDRLVDLGAVRELSGRTAFRIYGL